MAVLAFATTANAVPVIFSNVVSTWSNALPPATATFFGSGTGSASARWGDPLTAAGQSGYVFDAATPPSIVVNVPPSPSPTFDLGTFTHLNRPIASGTSITSIRLTVSADVNIDGTDFGVSDFVFDFTHNETENDAEPCAFGGANNQGVNINGCADRVTIEYNALSDSFLIGDDLFTLNIRGFEIDGEIVDEFLTTELLDNPADLVAEVTLRSTLVPEPATLALLGVGLMGLGAVARRRRA